MQAYDWQIPERLTRIRRAYTLMGHGVTYQTHYLSCSFGEIIWSGRPSDLAIGEAEIVAPSDGPYVWAGTMAALSVNGDFKGPRAVFVSFTLEKNGRNLLAGNVLTPGQQDSFQQVDAVCGTGSRPHFWNFPIILDRRDRVRVRLVNRVPGLHPTDLTGHIVCYGFRLYPLSLAAAGELN